MRFSVANQQMNNLLMITGLGSGINLAAGDKGAFYNTLEELRHYWNRIDIIVPRTSRAQTDNLFGNVYIHASPYPIFLHPIYFIKKALQLHRENHFNLMTVQEFPPFYNGIAAMILHVITRVPYILEIHHVPGYPKAANLKESIYKLMTRIFIRFDVAKAVAVRVVNQTQMPDFLKKSGVPRNKIVYIPSLYIDPEVFRPTGANKEYDLIFVGRLESNKGINLFLAAAEELNAKAIIVGPGSLKSQVADEIKARNLNIKLHGWAKDSSEVAELLNKSKILVMPSYNEGGPRVVAEAMACGVPVLATPVGIVPDFINEVGLEIDWDSHDIAQKARSLLNDPERCAKLSANGVELAKKFEKKSAIKNYYEIINRYAKS